MINADNLRAGIEFWTEHNWDSDFHNGLYTHLLELRGGGLTEVWWGPVVDELSRWKALRPYSKRTILHRGNEHLADLNDIYLQIHEDGVDPILGTTRWESLRPLFLIAQSIKSA